jgi:hypothetical protein
MRFELHITAVESPRARKIVAHNLAGHRSVSLAYAESLLENLPVLYMADLTQDAANANYKRLIEIGVQAKIIPMAPKSVMPREVMEEPSVQPPPATVSPEVKAAAPAPMVAKAPAPVAFIPGKNSTFLREARENDSRIRVAAIAVVVVVIAVLAAIFYAGGKMRSPLRPRLISSAGPDTVRTGKGFGGLAAPSGDTRSSRSAGADRRPVSEDDRLQSQAYVDSGKAVADRNGAIAFYKMAIGINKYNLDAWYGLLAAYTALGMEDEAAAVRDKMTILFGEGIFTTAKAVGRFGDMIDAYSTVDGTCHVEYRTRATGHDRLLHETFLIAKALGAQKDCAAFSFYAHPGKGRGGVLSYISEVPVPDGFQQYKDRAKVTSFE